MTLKFWAQNAGPGLALLIIKLIFFVQVDAPTSILCVTRQSDKRRQTSINKSICVLLVPHCDDSYRFFAPIFQLPRCILFAPVPYSVYIIAERMYFY